VRAYQFNAPGEMVAVDIPEPRLAPGEVLLKVLRIGMCGSDLSTYRGLSSMVIFPVIPGHEIAAEVAAVGAQVDRDFAIGELVTVAPYFNCGKCPACRCGRANACQFNETLGVRRPGALCEYIAIPQDHIVKVSQDLSAEQVALIEPLSVGYHLANRSRVAAGESVVVFGCGAVGLGAIAAASFKGARVTAVDIAAEKLAMAERFGAAASINSAQADPVARLLEETNGEGVDVAIECAGLPITFLQALEAVKYTGRMGVVSYSTNDISFNSKLIVAKELDIHGSRNAQGEFQDVQDMLLSAGLPLAEIITEQVELDDVADALHRWNLNPATMKVMVRLADSRSSQPASSARITPGVKFGNTSN
jgi:threonine dehydrogenase-like Zn-dependent dehydrogenase